MREVHSCLHIPRRTLALVVVADRRHACRIRRALDRVAPAVVSASIAVVRGWCTGRCCSRYGSRRRCRYGSRRSARHRSRCCRRSRRRCACWRCCHRALVSQLRIQIRCRMHEMRLYLHIPRRTLALVVVACCRRACRISCALDRVAPAVVSASIAVVRGWCSGRCRSRCW